MGLKVKQNLDGLTANHEGTGHGDEEANEDSNAVEVIIKVHCKWMVLKFNVSKSVLVCILSSLRFERVYIQDL